MGEAILTGRSSSNSSSSEAIGDIKLSCRTDLGNNYLLCNGANMYKGNSSNEAISIVQNTSKDNTIVIPETDDSGSRYFYVTDPNSSAIYSLKTAFSRKESKYIQYHSLIVEKYDSYKDLVESNPSHTYNELELMNSTNDFQSIDSDLIYIRHAYYFKGFIFFCFGGNITWWVYKFNTSNGELTKFDHEIGSHSYNVVCAANNDCIMIAYVIYSKDTSSSTTKYLYLSKSEDGINFTNHDDWSITIGANYKPGIVKIQNGTFYIGLTPTPNVSNLKTPLYSANINNVGTIDGIYVSEAPILYNIEYYNGSLFELRRSGSNTNKYIVTNDGGPTKNLEKTDISDFHTGAFFKRGDNLYLLFNYDYYKYNSETARFENISEDERIENKLPYAYFNMGGDKENLDVYMISSSTGCLIVPKNDICTRCPVIPSTDSEYAYIKVK